MAYKEITMEGRHSEWQRRLKLVSRTLGHQARDSAELSFSFSRERDIDNNLVSTLNVC